MTQPENFSESTLLVQTCNLISRFALTLCPLAQPNALFTFWFLLEVSHVFLITLPGCTHCTHTGLSHKDCTHTDYIHTGLSHAGLFHTGLYTHCSLSPVPKLTVPIMYYNHSWLYLLWILLIRLYSLYSHCTVL